MKDKPPKATKKDTAATAIARLEQQARELRAGHADYLKDLREVHKAEMAEATRLHAAAVAHEKTLSGSLKNVLAALTGGGN